jgi:4-amino-4-deoxy-L-arabinose transferase-like glycosyltransferase
LRSPPPRTIILSSTDSTMRRSRSLWIVLLVFAGAIVFINPIREVLTDDDFAYALMVRRLLGTGQYVLHDWAAANMPVQIYAGALLAKIFGYSFTTLRTSTLILLGVALVALYRASRDLGASDDDAGLLALVLLANPLVVALGFTFMTDVQFLGWFSLASLLYARALKGASRTLMAAGAVVATAAVGTRQFGIALPAGLLLVWFSDSDRSSRIPLYAIGIVPPAVAGLLQIRAGLVHPSFAQSVKLVEQAAYLAHPLNFAIEALWRLTAIVHYVGLFAAPLAPILLFAWIQRWRSARTLSSSQSNRNPAMRGRPLTILLVSTVLIGAGAAYSWQSRGPLLQSAPLALGAVAVAALIASLLYLGIPSDPGRSASEMFPFLTLVPLLALHISYTQFWDEYLLPFVPLTLASLVSAGVFRRCPAWTKALATVLCALALVSASLSTRARLEWEGAYWQASEYVRMNGIAPDKVGANWAWSSYYGAFDEWVAKRNRNPNVDLEMYFTFLEQRLKQTPYRLSETLDHMDGPPIFTANFRGWLFEPRALHVVRRVQSER